MANYLIKNVNIVNENREYTSDVLIKNGRIEKIASHITTSYLVTEIDGTNLHLLPGVIDDQVHFREPGLTHKGDIYTESKAAVAGGVTSFMEMPNVIPATTQLTLLEQKYQLAKAKSLANYSFYLGASNENLDQILQLNPKNVCGVKIFMGSSTGDLVVDNEQSLEAIFKNCPHLIATHCEDDPTIKQNTNKYIQIYGDDIPIALHPDIRSREACLLSSTKATQLAKKYNTRLHVLHISTAEELSLFDNTIPLDKKRITAEVCVHHLTFCDEDYATLGTKIKWNPAIKKADDRQKLWDALLNNALDVIATDHAPHTLSEKDNKYTKAPSGGPLVQFSLVSMLDFYHQKKISLETIVKKMAHDVAICFNIENRGFIREGYMADLVLVDLHKPTKVMPQNIYSKCGWSPFENRTFKSSVIKTFVNGCLVYDKEQEEAIWNESIKGQRLLFTI